jgi:two-component system chemotaxis sensor kinase CheA
VSPVDPSRYLGLFVAEAREHLAAAQELAARPDGLRGRAEPLRDLLRHAHSVKGMAATMGYRPMATLAHAVEDLLAAWRRGNSVPEDEHAALVVDGLVCLERMVASAERGAPVQDAETGDILRRLTEALAPLSGSGSDPASPVAAAPPTRAVRHFRIEIALSPSAPSPPVQAAMILGRLGKLGKVLKSDPPAAALRIGRVDGRVEALLETERSAEDVERELRSADAVASFRIEPVAAAPPSPACPAAPASWTRVRSDLLDAVLERVLDLTFEQERLAPPLRAASDRAGAGRLDRCRALVRALHADVVEMRLVAFETVAHRLSRAVHDLSRRLGKPVRFEIEGRDVRMDRSMLEALEDPLLHMVRNAVDHGIEAPEARAAAGKEPSGRITLAVLRRADRILVALEDDGAGIDAKALRLAALERGLIGPAEAARLGEADSLMLATLPGFSTADTLTEVSGRGVGLDAARAGIEALGGRLEIRSSPGRGAVMRITLPPSLALVQTLLVRSGGELFAVPAASVERMLTLGDDGTPPDARPHGVPAEVVRLDERLDLGPDATRRGRAGSALLCPAGERAMVLLVDEVLGRKEVVVKPLKAPLGLLREYSGATLLEDGSVVLVLDPAALLP